MKKQLISIFKFCTIGMILIACEGPAGPSGSIGPAGPAGPSGSNGTQGPAGSNGVDGKIEAKSTGWLTLDFEGGKAIISSYTQNGQGTDFIGTNLNLQLKDKKQALFTKEVLNKGLVLTYFKVNNIVFDETESAYSLAERIIGGTATASGFSYFKIPGRASNTFNDFVSCTLSNSEIGEDYWNPTFFLSTPIVQSFINNQTVSTSRAPELVNKSASFYRDLSLQNAPKIRIVVIPLSVSGRFKALDFSNYELVKKTFNIPD